MTDEDVELIRERLEREPRSVGSNAMARALLAEVSWLRAQLATARRDAWCAGRDAAVTEMRSIARRIVGINAHAHAETVRDVARDIAELEPPGDK